MCFFCYLVFDHWQEDAQYLENVNTYMLSPLTSGCGVFTVQTAIKVRLEDKRFIEIS